MSIFFECNICEELWAFSLTKLGRIRRFRADRQIIFQLPFKSVNPVPVSALDQYDVVVNELFQYLSRPSGGYAKQVAELRSLGGRIVGEVQGYGI